MSNKYNNVEFFPMTNQNIFLSKISKNDNIKNGPWTYEFLPQNEQLYLACCVTSIFLMTFRRVAPYRVPYLPQIPTFLVCPVIVI